MAHNPFLTDAPTNPFLSQEEQTAAEVSTVPHCGDPTCRRTHRPDGSHYSTDPKERMAQLTAEGRVGGQYGHLAAGRTKRTRRAAEVVAEMAAEEAQKIKKVFLDGIDEDRPMGIRLRAAQQILDIEADRERADLAQRAQEFDEMTKGELVENIIGALSSLHEAGQISAEVLDITDGEFVEEPNGSSEH